MPSPLRSGPLRGRVAPFHPPPAKRTADVPPPAVDGAKKQDDPSKQIICLDLPANIELKLRQTAERLGYGFERKDFPRLGKPPLSLHQIRGANSVINLVYWNEAQTRAPYQPNSVLALCVRICRETKVEGQEPPRIAFLTHDDCPKDWVAEAKDCAAIGIMRFLQCPLGKMEEWNEEGIEKIKPFANEMIREAQLTPTGPPATTLDATPSAANPGEAVRMANANAGPKVFISYAHADKDKAWFKALFEFLQPLRQRHPENFWSDVEIEPGNDWFQVISGALTSAPIVLFVVSPGLLASEFVGGHELGPALKDNKRILWIHGQKSLFRETAFKFIQAAHDPAIDLESATIAQRNDQHDRIAEAISAQLQKFVQYSGVTDTFRR